jgi:hypothetical protein
MSDQTEQPEEAPESPPAEDKRLTQEQFEFELGKRLARERAKYADYDDLKAKAGQWDEHEETQKSELEKLQGQIAKAEQAAQEALAERDSALIRNVVMLEAGKQGVPQERLAAALKLLDSSLLTPEKDGTVSGVEDAVKALLEASPFLLADDSKPPAPQLDSGAGGGARPGKGIVLTPLQREMARVSGMTEEAYIEYLQKQKGKAMDTNIPIELRSTEDG